MSSSSVSFSHFLGYRNMANRGLPRKNKMHDVRTNLQGLPNVANDLNSQRTIDHKNFNSLFLFLFFLTRLDKSIPHRNKETSS